MAKSSSDVKNWTNIYDFDDRIAKGAPRLEVSIQLDIFYKIIIDKLDLSLEDGTDRFIEGIKLYVFLGAMYESWTNDFIRRFLKGHKEAPAEFFDVMERQQLIAKLKVIQSKIAADWWVGGIKLISKVCEMRNRLMHFKDSPTSIELESMSLRLPMESVTYADFFHGLRAAAPNPKIYNDIVDQDLDALRAEAMDLYGKLRELTPPLPSEN